MQIFIDESGTFDTRSPNTVSILGSLMFPENLEYRIDKFFKKLNKRLSKEEKDKSGEPKGSLLTDKNLSFVFEFLARNKDFRISIKVFDSDINPHSALKEWRCKQAEKLKETLARYMEGPVKSPRMAEYIQAMINSAERDKKISDQDFAQVLLMRDLIYVSLQKAFMYYIHKKYANAFTEFHFRCDNKSSRKYKKYINDSIRGFLETERSGRRDQGLTTIKEMFFPGHPVERFNMDLEDGNEGFDIGKILEHSIMFEDSKNFKGLRLVDIIVSGIQGIILGKRDPKIFDGIRTNCAYFKNNWNAIDICRLTTSKPKESPRRKIYSYLQTPPKKPFNSIVKPKI